MANQAQKEQSVFDRKDPHPEWAVTADPDQKHLKAELDKALKQSFPASDPPAASQPTTVGRKKRAKKAA